jgi:membrane-anchored glycerophosphoryl diester phosphodiesterase (GDPDase)
VPEEDANDLNLPPFNWEKLFRRLFLVGLALWVIAGAVNAVLEAYFSGVLFGAFVTSSDPTGEVAVAISRFTLSVEWISFKVWIGSGVLMAYLWLRARATPN